MLIYNYIKYGFLYSIPNYTEVARTLVFQQYYKYLHRIIYYMHILILYTYSIKYSHRKNIIYIN